MSKATQRTALPSVAPVSVPSPVVRVYRATETFRFSFNNNNGIILGQGVLADGTGVGKHLAMWWHQYVDDADVVIDPLDPNNLDP